MKKFLSIAVCMLAIFACATFVSCGDDDNKSTDNATVVTPEKQSTTDSPVYWSTDASLSASKIGVLEFKTTSLVVRREYRNGTLRYENEYTFAINGNTISVTGDFDGQQRTVNATIKEWTDDKLVIDMGEIETYYKVSSLPGDK